MRVIPSFLSDGKSDRSTYTGSAFNSIRLLLGEVQERIETNDPRNRNKICPEYKVWAQFYENGTSNSRMLEGVVGPDIFGSGIADTNTWTYRGANSATTADGNNRLGQGLGSRVLVLAILGMSNNYVILGGIRNSKSTPDDPSLGHNYLFNFNGIEFSINNDGEATITYGGATNIDGTPRSDVDQEAVGTSVQFQKDGSLVILDKDSKELIQIDRPNGNINITASSNVSINAPQIKLGPNPNSPAVLGTQLVQVLQQLITQLSTLTVIITSPGSPSSPPVNAPAIMAISSQLNTILSQVNSLN